MSTVPIPLAPPVIVADDLTRYYGTRIAVDRVSFGRTYRQVGPGVYVKKTPVWAEVAAAAGRVKTKEGSTGYKRGDYLVFNEKNGADGYAVSAKKFKRMYVRAK